MRRKTGIIVIDEKDNVATALETLSAGAEVSFEIQGHIEKDKTFVRYAYGS